MTTPFKPKVIAVLGDSLSAGSTTNLRRSWTNLLGADPRISPRLAICSSGKSGDTSELMRTRYLASLQGQGFAGYVFQAGINNINVNDEDGATAYANILLTINDMLAEGVPVIFGIESPYSGAAVSTPTRQANYLDLRARLLATVLTGLSFVDFYPPYPAGMGDPNNPTAIYPPFNWSDEEHWGDLAQPFAADKYAAKLAQVFPP